MLQTSKTLKKTLLAALLVAMIALLLIPLFALSASAETELPVISANVRLGESFTANGKLTLPGGIAATEAGLYVDGVKKAGVLTDGYYLVESFLKAAAKEIGKSVTVQGYYIANGVEIKGTEIKTSIAALLRTYLNNSDENIVALATATLNYAAAAQTYFGYDTDNLVNTGLAATPSTGEYADNFAVVEAKPDAILAPREIALLLNDTVDLHISTGKLISTAVNYTDYFLSISENADMSDAATVAFNERGIAVVKAINPTKWNDTYYFCIVDGEGNAVSATFTYGVSTYFARMKETEDANLAALVGAMMALYEANEAYLAPDPDVVNTYAATDSLIRILGRTETNSAGAILFNNTASGFEVTFYGTSLSVTMCNAAGKSDTAKFALFIDGKGDPAVDQIDLSIDGVASGNSREITLCSFDKPGLHTVRLQKITQESLATAIFSRITVTGQLLPVEEDDDALRLMIFGDSIICGHSNMREDGAADTQSSALENGLLTYAMRAATLLGADAHVFSRSGLGLYTDPYSATLHLKDIYGKVSPASKTDWDMRSWIPDAVIINIGTNDIWATNGSTGNPPYSQEAYVAAYVAMVREMASIWGNDTTFFLCTSMMVPGLAPAVEEAALTLKAEYGIKAQAVNLPAQQNVGGHPTNASHEAAAEVLYNAILEADVDRPYIPDLNETVGDDISNIF